MRIRWWPRSIRWQMLAGLLLLETLSIGLFALLLIGKQARDLHTRTIERLAYEATSLALQTKESLMENRPAWIGLSARMMTDAPDVALAKVTDPEGDVLFVGQGSASDFILTPSERAEIPLVTQNAAKVFSLGGDRLESVAPIYTENHLRGFVWVEADRNWGHQRLEDIQHGTEIFGIIWIIASALLVLLMASSISRPLAILHRGATALMTSEGDGSHFPLPVAVKNEIGDLIETFNRMVASLAEQRAGLNDTLSLLDSMLANAPIGLAFVDRSGRFVRVNQVFAGLTGVAVSRHLGRTLRDLLPPSVVREMETAVQRVFASEEPVRNLELSGEGGKLRRPWTWLISAYPVRTTPNQVRWAGIIALDASERKRSEEALRRSEKLAVTGRLAASIAHEINNPLEAITNLLFLLQNFADLPEAARHYVGMAEYEVRRIAEITQQTLRFYRQPTQPARTALAELLDSVLSLYQGRINALELRVERDYDREMTLFCFSGEIRQVFANLVGNAIDASSSGGRLMIRARRSRDWKNAGQPGVRFAIADTGAGMDAEVREHIFEAFFTTKEVTGTGLGLWVSHEIILKHHGLVRVRSRAASGQTMAEASSTGTVFEIFIPDDANLFDQGNGAAV
ncbi:MAG: ATP-binding protein [Terracidiphilus sp.]